LARRFFELDYSRWIKSQVESEIKFVPTGLRNVTR
jgi:hypothetical protein